MVEVFSHVKRIKGVKGYVLLDLKGNILSHNNGIKTPEKFSRMVYYCGRKMSVIGKKHFKYMIFSRRNDQSILIFPVGNYYLGVIKQAGSRNFETASAVMEFLNILAGKSDKTEAS